MQLGNYDDFLLLDKISSMDFVSLKYVEIMKEPIADSYILFGFTVSTISRRCGIF